MDANSRRNVFIIKCVLSIFVILFLVLFLYIILQKYPYKSKATVKKIETVFDGDGDMIKLSVNFNDYKNSSIESIILKSVNNHYKLNQEIEIEYKETETGYEVREYDKYINIKFFIGIVICCVIFFLMWFKFRL